MFIMDVSLESLLTIAFSLTIVLVLILNVYLVKRNGFYVNVKCWFCNGKNHVLFQNRNSFDCIHCTQYNGFNKDGGYNKIIQAQYCTLGVYNNSNTIKTEPPSNGLCTYCNNNQRLKVQQLASFTPLNEKNYDVEVEHFRQQLEKSYKLCKRCRRVLQQTIEDQNGWIFGNRLKSMRTKSLHKLNQAKNHFKELKPSKFLRYCLIVMTVLILGQIIKIRIDLPHINNLKQILPKNFKYDHVFKDVYSAVCNATEILTRNVEQFKKHNNLKFDNNFLVTEILIGFLLQILLISGEAPSNLIKINELLMWILMLVTTVFFNIENSFIQILQMTASSGLIYSYSTNKSVRKIRNKYTIKKVEKAKELVESSDEEDEDFPQLFTNFHCQNVRASSPIQTPTFQNKVHNSNNFNTAKTTSSLHNSSLNNSRFHADLYQSLNNLNISSRPQPCGSPVHSISSQKRPILSPPRLNVTQNSWTAGGFWKTGSLNNSNEFPSPSRPPSQSSGFVSTNHSSSPSREDTPIGERNLFQADVPYQGNLHDKSSFGKLGQQIFCKVSGNSSFSGLNQSNILILQEYPSSYSVSNNFCNPFGRISPVANSHIMYVTKPPNNNNNNNLLINTQGFSDNSFKTPKY